MKTVDLTFVQKPKLFEATFLQKGVKELELVQKNHFKLINFETDLIPGEVVAPANQPTLLTFTNVTATSFDVSFTASVGGADVYLVIRRTSASPTYVPVDGTTYSVGQSVGDGEVRHFGAGVSFSESGLTASTTYHYDVFAGNGATGTWKYLTTSPLEDSQQTSSSFSFGNCLRFDGINDSASKTGVSVLGGKQLFSWSGWVWISSDNPGNYWIWAWSDNSNFIGMKPHTKTGNNFNLLIFFGTGSQWATTPNESLVSNQWNHIYWDFNGGFTNANPTTQNNGRLQVYINNVIQSLTFTGNMPPTTPVATMPIVVAKHPTVGFAWLKCLQDHTAINYDANWTAQERTDAYGSGLGGDLPSPKHLWKYDEVNPTTTAPDTGTVGGLDLTLINSNFNASSGWEGH